MAGQGAEKHRMLGFLVGLRCSTLDGSLRQAIDRGRVLRKGTYQAVDPSSWEVEAIEDRTAPEWRPAIADAVGLYVTAERRLRLPLRAVLIRGSVAKGLAADDGTADLDTFAYYTSSQPNNSDRTFRAWMQHEGRDLVSRVEDDHPMARRIEVRAMFAPPGGDVPHAFTAATQSVVVHGSCTLPRAAQVPPLHLAMDIRADYRRALEQPLPGPAADEAAQWFLKRALRAGMELTFQQVLYFSRDLVPCYEACASVFPDREPLFLNALQIACGAPCDAATVQATMREMCDWAEDAFLAQLEPVAPEDAAPPSHVLRAPPRRGPPGPLAAARRRASWLVRTATTAATSGPAIPEASFHGDRLPSLGFTPPGQVPALPEDGWRRAHLSAEGAAVYRGGIRHWRALSAWEPRYLQTRLTGKVDVMVAPSNVFTYCRDSHPWVAAGLFTAPSRRREIPAAEFFRRLTPCNPEEPLIYGGGVERMYLQSAAPVELLEDDAEVLGRTIGPAAQTERVWVSAAGSVSALHYDAADSWLLQIRGTKRMVFFPPDVLPLLDCYPVGHPLGRRSRVDPTETPAGSAQTAHGRHADFWATAAPRSQEVVLHPGDVVFFPARWAHYTESVTYSVSLTYRLGL